MKKLKKIIKRIGLWVLDPLLIAACIVASVLWSLIARCCIAVAIAEEMSDTYYRARLEPRGDFHLRRVEKETEWVRITSYVMRLTTCLVIVDFVTLTFAQKCEKRIVTAMFGLGLDYAAMHPQDDYLDDYVKSANKYFGR